jgi:hypothetical protein
LSSARTARVRPRLSRTFSAARWEEYRALLEDALTGGYRVVSLEHWLAETELSTAPTLILRHDVDQHPRSALEMAAIESELGLSSTWYFRWRTASPAVIARLRDIGSAVGLHYESLSRYVLREGLGPEDIDDSVVERCRATLLAEVEQFARRHGEIQSICPHGDSRVAFVSNATLVRGREMAEFGVRWDGNEAMRRRGLRLWLTDRSAAEGSWNQRAAPQDSFEQLVTPILCLTHPNNWTSGPSLWGDRLLSRIARSPPLGAIVRLTTVSTLGDRPPVDDA